MNVVGNGLVDDQALCAYRLVGCLRRVDVEDKVGTMLVHLVAQINLQLHAYAVMAWLVCRDCADLLGGVGGRPGGSVAGI